MLMRQMLDGRGTLRLSHSITALACTQLGKHLALTMPDTQCEIRIAYLLATTPCKA